MIWGYHYFRKHPYGENNLQTKSHLPQKRAWHSAIMVLFQSTGLLGLDVFFCTQMSANDLIDGLGWWWFGIL